MDSPRLVDGIVAQPSPGAPVELELFDHVTRLLLLAPARCASADALHRRTCSELGCDVAYSRFVEALHGRPDRFALLAPGLGDEDGWHAAERDAYGAALREAGLSPMPLVMLAERPHQGPDAGDAADMAHATGHDDGPCRTRYGAAPAAPYGAAAPAQELLAELHGAVAELLRAAGDDAGLRDAVGLAMNALVAAERQDGLRSSTPHHCSSTSSASTSKPAARAAATMPGASSTRMPARMDQPPGRRAP
jgi:hypothetical protein